MFIWGQYVDVFIFRFGKLYDDLMFDLMELR